MEPHQQGCRSTAYVALAPATLRQTQFGMHAAHPTDDENDLGDNLVDDGANDALFEPRRPLGVPDGLEITGQGGR